MYSRKIVEPRMKHWVTPTLLTGYSCEDFPFRATWNLLLPRKEEMRPNIWPEIPSDLRLWRRPDPVERLGYIKCYSLSTPDLLKARAILADTTVRISAVDREDLKLCWKSEKRPHFSEWSTILLFTSFQRLY